MKKIIIVLCALIVMAMFTACTSAEDLAVEAEQAFSSGQWELAIEKSRELQEKAETDEQKKQAEKIILESEDKIRWKNLQEYVYANKDTIEFNDHLKVSISGKSIYIELSNIESHNDQGTTINVSDFINLSYTCGEKEGKVGFRRYEGYYVGNRDILRIEDELSGVIVAENYKAGDSFSVESYEGDEMILHDKGEKACTRDAENRLEQLLAVFERACLKPVSMTLDMVGFSSY